MAAASRWQSLRRTIWTRRQEPRWNVRNNSYLYVKVVPGSYLPLHASDVKTMSQWESELVTKMWAIRCLAVKLAAASDGGEHLSSQLGSPALEL